jgi:hypothetical protein
MSYQVRHKRLGVFQGVELTPEGVAVCYHPAADTPEMGYCEFKTSEEAVKFIQWTLSIPSLGYAPSELKVEHFNKESSDYTQQVGIHLITMEHWTRLLNLHV